MVKGKRKRHGGREQKSGGPCAFLGAAAGIAGALFVISLSVIIILNLRPLYVSDIGRFQIEAESGMEKETILRNYDALIRYNRLCFRGPLEFPDLPMSASARIHFEEVKRIFDFIQILCPAAGLLFACGVISRRQRKRTLKTAGISLFALMALLGVLALGGWERFFVGFHQLFFHNDYWLFDPVTDPVILLLPDGYFLHCAVGIAALCAAGAALCLAFGRRARGGVS